MNISASASSFSSQASATSRPAQGPPPKKQETLAAALTAVGVDDSTASSVLSQVEEAVEEVKSSSASGSTSETAIRSAIDGVLEANGIDSEKVGEAIQGNRPAGPRPGRGPKPEEDDSSTVESALLAADVDETEVDQLLNQLIETLTEQQESQSGNVSSESVRAAWTQVLEDNGVNVEKFEQALGKQLGSTGNFFNRVA